MEVKRRPSLVKITKPRHSILIQEEVLSAKIDVVGHDELEVLWQELDSWSFDIFKVANEDLPKMAERIFIKLGLLTTFPIDSQKLRAFIECMVAQYRAHVPFHNFRHACDVLHAMYLFIKLGGLEDKINDLEKLALCISALCHDVDHPGLTNAFLVACNDPLAIRYNDISVLENHHASVTVKALTGYESMNILGIFPDPEQRYIRKLIVTCILATDMAHHTAVVNTFSARSKEPDSFQPSSSYVYHPPPPPKKVACKKPGIFEMEEQEVEPAPESPRSAIATSEDTLLLMKMIMKCSDLSNTIRPFPLSKKWAALLLLEWFRQGDVERRLGMEISRNMDRNDPDSLQSMTLGCIDVFSTPMYEAAAAVLPNLRGNVLPNLTANREAWMSFSTAGPLEEEVQIILGSFFQVERDEEQRLTLRKSLRTSQSLQIPTPEPSHAQALQRPPSETKKPSTTSYTTPSNERPLSLLFGAPLGRDVNTLASELAWNTTLRDSSLRVNLVPSSRRSQSGSIGSLQLGSSSSTASGITERGSGTSLSVPSVEELQEGEGKVDSVRDSADMTSADFFTRLRARALAVRLSKLLDSRLWTYFVAIPATLIALFLNDFNRAVCPKSVDPFVEVIYLICLFLFLLELVTLSVLKPAYLFSFAFWLDLVGSLTLLPYMFGLIRQNLIVARIWKAAESLSRLAKKLQNKSAKIPSAFLVSRLAKAVFYHIVHPSELTKKKSEETNKESSDYFMSTKPSHLWLRLSDLQSQRLVLGILILAIALPYFYHLPEDLAPRLALASLDTSPLNTLRFNQSLDKLHLFNDEHGYAIVYLGCRDACPPGYCSGYVFSEGDPFVQVVPTSETGHGAKADVVHKYRKEELVKVTSDSRRCEAYYSIRTRVRKDHVLNMGLTLLTLSILSALSFLLSWDANMLLVQPIERMVNFIKELADNPGAFVGKSISRKSRGRSGKVMETRMLEGALVKIAGLSKVALGDAGMDILSVNLKGTEFNPMVPGKKIRACFGFCDIRNFTDATECLQEDVMMFVNKIADVVHNKAIMHNGFPNKNVGDAFLVVWKKNISDGAQKWKGSSFADRALISFLDVINALETSDVLHEYAMHPAIQHRMPGYTIKMGFGLHVGWAIEGAIGSSHKVDPSYLSPHVNMASRLEAATKQYGVMILISETVISNLTKSSLRDCCRKVDRVTVKGSAEPLTLYTYDLPMFQGDLKALYADYKTMFEAAVDSYIVGNWHTALERLRECVNLWHSDKPARLLTGYMGSHKNMVPANWKGYRELQEK